jgi:hypothetical protein
MGFVGENVRSFESIHKDTNILVYALFTLSYKYKQHGAENSKEPLF